MVGPPDLPEQVISINSSPSLPASCLNFLNRWSMTLEVVPALQGEANGLKSGLCHLVDCHIATQELVCKVQSGGGTRCR